MQDTIDYQRVFKEHLQHFSIEKEPVSLYKPINYILHLGGKRLRPVLTLITCELFNGTYQEALDAALSIEVFHNFSLIHDDIMDNAPLRRGKETVHEKWDINTGILSGDAMLILAYQLFENYEPQTFQALAKLFSKTALQVCEGQQYDIDFENREDVSVEEYLTMIEYKTAVLVGASMQMGAIVAKASIEEQQHIYNFGRYLGIAFQLQDDYLDAFGNSKTFGKQIGGDIIENKKTFLYLKAIENSSTSEAQQLEHLYTISPSDSSQKIETVKAIFEHSGAAQLTKDEIHKYTQKAFDTLAHIQGNEDKKALLKSLGESLLTRTV